MGSFLLFKNSKRERRWEEMEGKKIHYLFLFTVLILVLSSCHPRHVSDIKPNMTREEVISLWGNTDLITYKTVDRKTVETWEYHFATSDSICWINFIQDRVTTTQCRRLTRYYYPYPYRYYYPYYYPYSPYWW